MKKTITSLILVLAMSTLALNSIRANTSDANAAVTSGSSVVTMSMMSGTAGGQEVGAMAPEIAAGFANSSIVITISTSAGTNGDATFTTGVYGWDGATARSGPMVSSINNTAGSAPDLTIVSTNMDRSGGGNARSGPMSSSSFTNTTANQDETPAPQDANEGRLNTAAAMTPSNNIENG